MQVSTHSHPKVAAHFYSFFCQNIVVSTHSHPKVAARLAHLACNNLYGFNTQPPEGGCQPFNVMKVLVSLFQHTATRRWLLFGVGQPTPISQVSTHSHPKVAAGSLRRIVGIL